MLPVKNVLSKSQNQEHFHENTIIYIRCIHENRFSSVCFLSRKIRPSKLTLEKFDRRFIPKRFDNIPCVSQEPWNNITHIQYDYSKIILPYKLCIIYAMSSKYITHNFCTSMATQLLTKSYSYFTLYCIRSKYDVEKVMNKLQNRMGLL